MAHEYDATRGGVARGQVYAAALERLLPAAEPLVEVGVGTGVVAEALQRNGRWVAGVDLSTRMLATARGRLGPRVVVGDAQRLPLGTGSVAAAYSVWVLHLVGDPAAVFREVHRVVRPGGRYVVVSSSVDPPPPDDEIGAITWEMQQALRGGEPKPDHPSLLVPQAQDAGWVLSSLERHEMREWEQSPAAAVETVESRTWSLLWDVDDATWSAVVEPSLAALRALADPDVPRLRRSGEWLLALDRAG